MDDLRKDEFLSRHLGKPAWVLAKSGINEKLKENLPSSPCFVSCRISDGEMRESSLLKLAGFRLAECTYTYSRKAGSPSSELVPVRMASPQDEIAVGKIAADSFVLSRFRADPEIPASAANAFKEEWARNFFRGKRGHQMFVAQIGGSVAGFLQALYDPKESVATIDLIATADGFRGKGVARSLIAAFVNFYKNAHELRVGTQETNGPSQKLYESEGFKLAGKSFVFHLHRA